MKTDKQFFLHLYPPSEKATLALYFGRIRTRLGVVHFRAVVSFDILKGY